MFDLKAYCCGSILAVLCVSACAGPVVNVSSEKAASPEEQAESSPDETHVITLQDYHTLRSVTVRVGEHDMPFLFDTGGGVTLVTPRMASQIGCEPFGQLSGYRMRGERVDFPRCENVSLGIQGHEVAAHPVGVFDLMPLLPAGWEELGGLLTLSSFETQPISLELWRGQGRIIIESQGSMERKTAQMNPVEMRLVKQASGFSTVVVARADTKGGDVWVELDSGSTAPLIIAPHVAGIIGIDLDDPDQARLVSEDPRIWEVDEVTLQFGEAAPITTSARVMDMIYDANMGMPLLAKFQWTMDLATQRLWLSAPDRGE